MLPVLHERGGADHERRQSAAFRAHPLHREPRERLQRFTQTHFVGEDAAERAALNPAEPQDAVDLIGAQHFLQRLRDERAVFPRAAAAQKLLIAPHPRHRGVVEEDARAFEPQEAPQHEGRGSGAEAGAAADFLRVAHGMAFRLEFGDRFDDFRVENLDAGTSRFVCGGFDARTVIHQIGFALRDGFGDFAPRHEVFAPERLEGAVHVEGRAQAARYVDGDLHADALNRFVEFFERPLELDAPAGHGFDARFAGGEEGEDGVFAAERGERIAAHAFARPFAVEPAEAEGRERFERRLFRREVAHEAGVGVRRVGNREVGRRSIGVDGDAHIRFVAQGRIDGQEPEGELRGKPARRGRPAAGRRARAFRNGGGKHEGGFGRGPGEERRVVLHFDAEGFAQILQFVLEKIARAQPWNRLRVGVEPLVEGRQDAPQRPERPRFADKGVARIPRKNILRADAFAEPRNVRVERQQKFAGFVVERGENVRFAGFRRGADADGRRAFAEERAPQPPEEVQNPEKIRRGEHQRAHQVAFGDVFEDVERRVILFFQADRLAGAHEVLDWDGAGIGRWQGRGTGGDEGDGERHRLFGAEARHPVLRNGEEERRRSARFQVAHHGAPRPEVRIGALGMRAFIGAHLGAGRRLRAEGERQRDRHRVRADESAARGFAFAFVVDDQMRVFAHREARFDEGPVDVDDARAGARGGVVVGLDDIAAARGAFAGLVAGGVAPVADIIKGVAEGLSNGGHGKGVAAPWHGRRLGAGPQERLQQGRGVGRVRPTGWNGCRATGARPEG